MITSNIILFGSNLKALYRKLFIIFGSVMVKKAYVKYSQEIADKICILIATTSKGISVLCKEQEGMPDPTTIFQWLKDHEDFSHQYARAREQQAELLADEIITISDDSSQDNEIRYTASGESYMVENKEWTNRSKLRVDARKWKAAHLAPKVYGDRIQQDVNHSGQITTNVIRLADGTEITI